MAVVAFSDGRHPRQIGRGGVGEMGAAAAATAAVETVRPGGVGGRGIADQHRVVHRPQIVFHRAPGGMEGKVFMTAF